MRISLETGEEKFGKKFNEPTIERIDESEIIENTNLRMTKKEYMNLVVQKG